MIELTAISTLWKLFAWMPKFILRRMFTKEKLSNLIMFDVRPRYEYAHVDLGEVSKYTLWLQLTNLAPVAIELDRAEIVFGCAGAELKSSILKRDTIESGETMSIHVSGTLDSCNAAFIARTWGANNSYISANIEFNCVLHNFSKQTGRLEGVIPSFINAPKNNE